MFLLNLDLKKLEKNCTSEKCPLIGFKRRAFFAENHELVVPFSKEVMDGLCEQTVERKHIVPLKTISVEQSKPTDVSYCGTQEDLPCTPWVTKPLLLSSLLHSPSSLPSMCSLLKRQWCGLAEGCVEGLRLNWGLNLSI